MPQHDNNAAPPAPQRLEDQPDDVLRAWADAGIIPLPTYMQLMEEREKRRAAICDKPEPGAD